MITLHEVLRLPFMTEKAVTLKEKKNTVVFKVHPDADKRQIKEAVERFFKVKVAAVRTMNFAGKEKRFGRKVGRRSDWKKALVVLGADQKIDFV